MVRRREEQGRRVVVRVRLGLFAGRTVSFPFLEVQNATTTNVGGGIPTTMGRFFSQAGGSHGTDGNGIDHKFFQTAAAVMRSSSSSIPAAAAAHLTTTQT